MRVSDKWLKELVDVDDNILNIANNMVHVGNEYESINKLCPSTNLVVGRIVTKVPHKDSDHLNVCTVDLGDKIYQIVCGAKNVEVGQKVIVSRVGAILPAGEIKQTVIRGVESNGMICSLAELGIESKYIKETDKLGIHVLPESAPIGVDALSYLGLDDSFVDYELTANRSDLLSMIGMAYETSAIYGKKVKYPEINLKEAKDNIKDYVTIENKTNNCYAYLSRIVKNIEIKESPDFIKSRLMCAGIRPVNNVVDISNYVMIEYGQPLHFFDYDKLGNKIIIREAFEGEKITTLDKQERILKSTDIVICDSEKPVALAGVMGGLDTEITNQTKNILIESAIFNPYNIRYTSKEILRSEASIRFEKGIDPNITKKAIDRAAYLLQEYASGEVVSGITGFNDKDLDDKEIEVTSKRINDILGMDIKIEDVGNIFNRLGFTYKENNGLFKVMVPTRRLDINIKEDLIEEVGRIYGYDNIESKLPVTKIRRGTYLPKNKYVKDIKNRLSSLNLNEVITYSLVGKQDIFKFCDLKDKFKPIKLLSPLSEDKSLMRYSITPSLLKIADYNISRNIKDINIYEISKIYYESEEGYEEVTKLSILMYGNYLENPWGNKVTVDFYLIKGILENLLSYLGLLSRYKLEPIGELSWLHSGIGANIFVDNECIGYIGRVTPVICKKDIYVLEVDLDKIFNFYTKNIKYKEIPKYPSIIKDAAFILNKNINSIEVVKTIKKEGKIISNVEVFDVYNIDSKLKSIAFKITFSDPSKTLTDEEVNKTFNQIIEKVEKNYNAELRNK